MIELRNIVLEVTQACNHACAHCYNYWSEDRTPVRAPDALSREQILRLLREVRSDASIRTVAISGGEPFLRPDLDAIVGDLVDDGLNVTVITNASRVTSARLSSFPRELFFELTLFSAREAVHDRMAGRAGALRDVIDAAIAIRRHGAVFAVSCVVGKENAADLEDTLILAVGIGASAVIVNRINLARHSYAIGRRLIPEADTVRAMLEAANGIAAKFGLTIGISIPIPPCVVDLTPFKHLQFGWCPRGSKDAYYTISYNGLLRPCNHSSVILGDLRTQSFAEILDSPQTRAFWAARPPACTTCRDPLREVCAGGCPAASDECYGTRLKMDPFIEFAGTTNASAAFP